MIHYSTSFKQFLSTSDSMVARVLWRLYHKRYEPLMVSNAEVDYITFRRDGTISYLPAGKEHRENDNGDWERDGRQNGRPAKVIRKLFHPRVQKFIKDVDFENFSNAYKAAFSDDGLVFNILPNSEIKNVYDMDMMDGSGSLNGSCMNGDSGYLDIYENCDKLRIVTLTNDEGLLCGRALLWDINEEITFLDRFYVVKDFMYDMWVDYARENGFWYKQSYKSYNNKTIVISPSGEMLDKCWTIRTDTDFGKYPYIDTFQYGDDGSLNNHCEGRYAYTNTSGGREGEGIEDEINGGYVDEDDSVYISYGDSCYRDRTTSYESCVEIGGEWYHLNDSHIVDIDGTWYLKDDEDVCDIDNMYYLKSDCCYSEFTDEWHLEDDCVYSNHHSTYIPNGDAVEIFGEYYHENDVNRV